MYLLAHLALGSVAADLVRRLRRAAGIDFRWVLVGAILPDLIDKPLGIALGITGRAWAHTALVSLALSVFGLAAMRRGSAAAAASLALGSWTHLVLDQMWEMPAILWYPLFGFAFPPGDRSLLSYVTTLLTDPLIWGGEIVGAAVLVAMAWRLGVRDWRSVRRFLATGALAHP